MRLKYPSEITWFPLFQNVTFFVLSMNNEYNLFKYFLLNYKKKKKSAGNLESVSKQPLKKACHPLVKDHTHLMVMIKK